LEELESFGVKIESVWEKKLTPNLIEALKFQIARVRQLKFEADQGIGMLSAESRPCIEAASELYCGIVDEVEKIDYQIFSKRAKTSIGRRLSVAVPAYLKAIQSRR
jgi:phytoene synthase